MAGCAGEKVEKTELSETLVTSESHPKDTPVRVGTQGYTSASFSAGYSFEEVVEKADLIADITIVEWLGEVAHTGDPDNPSTYFTAKINHTFKGEEYDTIVFKQYGNSNWTFDFEPLYKIGDRFFMIMGKLDYDAHKEEGIIYDVEFKNAFSAGYFTHFMVWEYEGEDVILSRFNWGHAQYLVKDEEVEVADKEQLDLIVEDFLEHDPLIEELIESGIMRETLGYAFDYDDVIEKIVDILEEVES
jgi:hypothetical protein